MMQSQKEFEEDTKALDRQNNNTSIKRFRLWGEIMKTAFLIGIVIGLIVGSIIGFIIGILISVSSKYEK